MKSTIHNLDNHLNPKTNIDLVIVYYQNKPTCLRPYNTLWSCWTFFSLPDSVKDENSRHNLFFFSFLFYFHFPFDFLFHLLFLELGLGIE